jgi:RecA/RadA recombinase
MSLLERLKKASTVKATEVLSESQLFNKKDMCPTDVPILNLALSGDIAGGLVSGLTVVAGPSKHFKSNLSLLMASAYMKKYPEAVCLLYDTEFGITPEYLKSMNVDPDRCIHTPIEHVEMLKFDLTRQLEGIERGDKVVIVIDSVGNIASKKELDDALDGKSVADMSRAKALKSLFRIVTPYLTTRDIPLIAVNHTYEGIGMFSTTQMSGGTGIYYSANQIFFMGRQQEKDGKQVTGYNFMLGVEKSRFVREKTRLPLSISWEGGVNKWSGLLDLGVELGWVNKPSVGWFEGFNPNTGEVTTEKCRAKDTNNADFWLPLFKAGYAEALKKRFAVGEVVAIVEDIIEEDIEHDETESEEL